MKKLFCIIFLSILFKTSFSQNNNYKVENTQQRQATYIIDQIEKNNIDSIYKHFDPQYFKTQNVKIKKILTKFHSDYTAMNPLAKRFITLVWPTGYNLFRFRYIDSTGIALQIDLSYKKDDINSRIFLLETIDKETLKKQRESSLKGPQIINVGQQEPVKYPKNTIIEFRNCNKEMRTVTFGSQLRSFKNWVYGQGNMETNKAVQFSNKYKLDSTFIRENILNIRNALPENFWNFSSWGAMYNNEPNEEAIWFMHLFSQIDKNGNVKIFAAYKITFEGTDARQDINRTSPKITNVEFILDKEKLAELEKELKKASKPE
jgi:hypothetical protein